MEFLKAFEDSNEFTRFAVVVLIMSPLPRRARVLPIKKDRDLETDRGTIANDRSYSQLVTYIEYGSY